MNEENRAGSQQPRAGLRAQIDLSAPVAVWVFTAHAIALLSPLVLLWAVYANWDYVAGQANAPGFFYVAVAFMMASGAFEFAQNTADRWYLRAGRGRRRAGVRPEAAPAEAEGDASRLVLGARASRPRRRRDALAPREGGTL